jgi:RimJ/RimL family protein N-acetyltransferase
MPVVRIALPERLDDGVVALRPLRTEDAAPYAAAFREDPQLGHLLGVEQDPDESATRGLIERQDRHTEDAKSFQRVEMTTIPENQAVPALAARLGFTQEGILRSRDVERGRRVDIMWFGLLREEWQGS